MQEIVDLLRLQDVRFTPALLHDVGEFNESIACAAAQRPDPLDARSARRDPLLRGEPAPGRSTSIATRIVHFVVAPSFLARRLLRPASSERRARRPRLVARSLLPRVLHAARRGAGVPLRRLRRPLRALRLARAPRRRAARDREGCRDPALPRRADRGHRRGLLGDVRRRARDAGRSPAKGLARAAREQFERAQLLGEVGRREASNPVTFANAHRSAGAARRARARATAPGRERSRDTLYVRGPAFDELPALRDRLASALGEG